MENNRVEKFLLTPSLQERRSQWNGDLRQDCLCSSHNNHTFCRHITPWPFCTLQRGSHDNLQRDPSYIEISQTKYLSYPLKFPFHPTVTDLGGIIQRRPQLSALLPLVALFAWVTHSRSYPIRGYPEPL